MSASPVCARTVSPSEPTSPDPVDRALWSDSKLHAAGTMNYRVISIGTLSHHELWPQPSTRVPSHASTTLVRSGEKVILVDPGLPPPLIAARLTERTGLQPTDVTDVFLTNFRPAHRRGLSAFGHARWLIGEREQETVKEHLSVALGEPCDESTKTMIEQDLQLLQRCRTAPDRLADNVDLFPLPGFTPGTCGLLLCAARWTGLIAGDAVATAEHLEQGRVLRGSFDATMAVQSLAEAVQIADIIVLGHDNVVLNPTRPVV